MKKTQFIKYYGRTPAETAACSEYVKQWWPKELKHRLRIADEVRQQIFLFDLPWDMEQTQIPVQFDGAIDWQYQPDDDPEFTYQLNRHRYWVCLGQAYAVTGDEQYVRCYLAQLHDWIEKNPLDHNTKKTTWRTIEAGLRAEAWIKSMGYMAASPLVTDAVFAEFLTALKQHGEYLAAHDVPFSTKSNWGVLENSGLYAIGKVFELDDSDCSFAQVAVRRLVRQLNTQIMDDGVHWEQSPMYHNEVLKCCLEVLRIADKTGDELPPVLAVKAQQMAIVNRIWQQPDGSQPAVGDSDVTDLRDVLTICAWQFRDPVLKSGGFERIDFEGIWDYGCDAAGSYAAMEKVMPETTSFWLKDSGNCYLRSGWQETADYLHLRCGSLGGGHGHFDKLHINLWFGGEEFFTDCGRYTYVDGDKRRELKGSLSHNTIVVDGQDYSRCIDSWDVAGLPLPVNAVYNRKGIFTLFGGGHLGYQEKGIYLNRKVLAVGTKMILIMDEIFGSGTHSYRQQFHLPGSIAVEAAAGGWLLNGQHGAARIVCLSEEVTPVKEPCLISRHYNQLESGNRIAFEASDTKTGAHFNGFLTAVWAAEDESDDPVIITKVPVESPVSQRVLDDREAKAVKIDCGKHSYVVVFAHVDIGSDCEYIGACGMYGLGRVMAGEWNQEVNGLQVLQW